MITYKKYDLIKECLSNYYSTCAYTLDTLDFVPAKYNDKIVAYLFKVLKKKFKKINREDRKREKALLKLIKMGEIPNTTSLESVLADYQEDLLDVENSTSESSSEGGDSIAE